MKNPTVLVTQSYTPSLDATYNQLREYFGAKITFQALTGVSFLSLPQFRLHKALICEHTAFLFTNRVVLDGFFKLAKECSIFFPKTTKYFLATEGLQNHLGKHIELRKRKIFFGQKEIEDLLSIMHKYKKEKFLLPCSDLGRPVVSDFFAKKKYHYTELPIYHTVYHELQGLQPEDYDVVVFYSPFSVEAFAQNFPNYNFATTKIAAFSSATIQAVQEKGWKIAIEAPREQTPSMVQGLINFFDKVINDTQEDMTTQLATLA